MTRIARAARTLAAAAAIAASSAVATSPVVAAPPSDAPPAAPVDDPEVAAERLHKAALEAFKKGDRTTAISLWLNAQQFHPFWKYAYNLANTYFQAGGASNFVEAWRWLVEAKRTMREHLDMLGNLEASLSVELAKTHAWVDVQVLPPEARVLKDNEPWQAPRSYWTTATSAHIEMSAPGYEPLTKDLSLSPGTRVVETYVLVPLQRGELVVSGAPEGASVSVAAPGATAVTVGTLPRVSVVLQPGTYEVTIEDPEYVPRVAKVEIVDSATFELPVILRKLPPKSRGLDGQEIAGLVTAGVGVIAGVVGGIMLASAENKNADMRTLNGDADHLRDIGYDAYVEEYQGLKDDRDNGRMLGWIGVGVGGAAIVTGVVLVLTGGGEPGPPKTEGHVDVTLGASRGGASVTLGTRF